MTGYDLVFSRAEPTHTRKTSAEAAVGPNHGWRPSTRLNYAVLGLAERRMVLKRASLGLFLRCSSSFNSPIIISGSGDGCVNFKLVESRSYFVLRSML